MSLDPLPTIVGDPTLLQHAVSNLLSNAVKFSPPTGGRIVVLASDLGSRWRIGISDNGCGIAPELHERVFRAFDRGTATSDVPGTGIGLAICQKVIERHHGRIFLESSPGAGTTVWFELPKEL